MPNKSKLNLKYYNSNNKYSDGNVESDIIKYLKSPKTNDEILEKHNNWPVYYHLSRRRQNILNWYPFKENSTILEIGAGMGAITPLLCSRAKKVTCIESSKRRASAIELRTQEYNNLEIIVGDFDDIKLSNKYDYITLIGVFEYAKMFSGGNENAYIDMLNRIKKLLKPSGKILVAIENRFGLKYWCGADEDHTGKVFNGINNYDGCNTVKTFSKSDLINMFNDVGLNYKFYYTLPDYKFPDKIVNDEYLKDNNNFSYVPYYCRPFNMFASEKELFAQTIKNGVVDFFANSYFIELSLEDCKNDISFVKINNSRAKKYSTVVYKQGDKYYKKALYDEGKEHVNNIYNYDKLLKKYGIKTIDVHVDDEIYTKSTTGKSLSKYLSDLYFESSEEKFYSQINKYIAYMKKYFKKEEADSTTKTIFETYGIKNVDKKKFYIVKDGFIDLVFQNIIIKNNEWYAFDQEWYEENVPLEYIVYRSLKLFVNDELYLKGVKNSDEVFKKIVSNIDLDIMKNIDLFDKLEKKFVNKVFDKNIENIIYSKYIGYNDYSDKIDESIKKYDELKRQNNELKNLCNNKEAQIETANSSINKLQQENEVLRNNLNAILNSKTWRMKTKINKILKRGK